MDGPRILVMGVAGCGKSTLGGDLSQRLAIPLIEGDDHHSEASQAKMRAGIALDDADRLPWLDALGALLAGSSRGAVLTCSALKRRYRDRLRAAVPGLRIVFLDIAPDTARARVGARPAHIFPASLVSSQFDALEPPQGEADVLPVDAGQTRQAQTDAVLDWLNVSHPDSP